MQILKEHVESTVMLYLSKNKQTCKISKQLILLDTFINICKIEM